MKSRNSNPQRKLAFQQLENRQLMTGNVSVSVQNHALVVNGDSHDNYLRIEQVGNGQYMITGDYSTTINGKSTPQTFSGVTGDFKIDLKSGRDLLSIGTDMYPTTTTVVPHNVSVKNASDDQISIRNTEIGGNFSVSGGNGSYRQIDVEHTDIKGGVSIDVDSGFSLLRFDYDHIGDPSVNQGQNDFNVDAGRGGFFLGMGYTTVERDLNVKTDGNKTDVKAIGLVGGWIGRNATFEADGDSADSISINEFTIVKKLSIKTGNGIDHVALGGVDSGHGLVSPVPPSAMWADEIFVDLGKGDDVLQFGGNENKTGGGAQANKATYLGGDGVDRVLNQGVLNLFGSFAQFESMPKFATFFANRAVLAVML